jgi:hypothetical protein
MNAVKQNVAAEWLEFLLRIRQFLYSNPGLEAGYLD